MGREPILDAKKKRIGYIETTSSMGRTIIRDQVNRIKGELRTSGNKIEAFDASHQRLGYYDKLRDETFDRSNKRLGKGNLLLNFFF